MRSSLPCCLLLSHYALAVMTLGGGCADPATSSVQTNSSLSSSPLPPSSASAPAATPAPLPDRCVGMRCLSIERCDEATGQCAPHCPAGEVYIPATGPNGFVMGKGLTVGNKARTFGKGHLSDSDVPHRVILTKPFCMDEAEVTVRAMKECVDKGSCDAPKIAEVRANYPKKLDHPSNETSFFKAKKFCEVQGKRLPTEAQWEWAATGGDGRAYPWGNETPTSCEFADFTLGVLISPGGDSGCHGGGTSPVKSHPRGNKAWPSGDLYDMAGNVWEWCEDVYLPYKEETQIDPLVENKNVQVHVVRGGGWNRPARGIMSAFRGAAIDTYEVGGLGFRCVRNPAP